MTADALKTIHIQTMVIRNVINKLDYMANAMHILDMPDHKINQMVCELDGVIGKIDQATSEIAIDSFNTAEQNSVNLVNAALAGRTGDDTW